MTPQPETLEHIHATKAAHDWCLCWEAPNGRIRWWLCYYHEGYDAAVRQFRPLADAAKVLTEAVRRDYPNLHPCCQDSEQLRLRLARQETE